MSYADVIARNGEGALVYALTIEGIDTSFTSHSDVVFNTTGMPSGLTQLRGALSPSGIKWGAGADLKSGGVRIPDNTFKLVDVESSSGVQHKITDILRGVEAVRSTELRGNISTGLGAFIVASTTGWSSGDKVYIDQETITVDVTNATTFTPTARGVYGSLEAEHFYEGTDAALRADGPLRPLVTSAPISWYGRRVTLWVAELRYGSAANTYTTSTPTAVWKGRILDNYAVRGMTWEIPCEPLWTAIDTQIPTMVPLTTIKGVNFDGPMTIDWEVRTNLGVTATVVDSGTATISGDDLPPYPSILGADGFAEHFASVINDSLDVGGNSHRIEVTENTSVNALGEVPFRGRLCIQESGSTWGTDYVFFRTENRAINYLLNNGPGGAAQPEWFTSVHVGGPNTAFLSEFFMATDWEAPFNLLVQDSSQFSDLGSSDGLTGDGYEIWALVRIINKIYKIVDVPGGGETLTLHAFRDLGVAGAEEPRENVFEEGIAQVTRDPPILVEGGLYMVGDFTDLWQQLIENTSIPSHYKGFLRTEDFDWTGIKAAGRAGAVTERERVFFKPRSFRELFKQDLEWVGAYPTISSSGVQISARTMGASNQADVRLTITNQYLVANHLPTFSRGKGRLINTVSFRGGFSWVDEDYLGDAPLVFANRTLQQSYQTVPLVRELKNSGVNGFSPLTDAEFMAPVAMNYFTLFGRDNPVIAEFICTAKAANLVPGDTVKVSHWLLPDMGRGRRGVTDENMLVTENIVQLVEGDVQCKLTLIWLVDNAKRSGYAPTADVASVSGADLTLVTGEYATEQNEGLYFEVGEFVVVQQHTWTPGTSPLADESFQVDTINADGTVITLSGTPGASMVTAIGAGQVWLIHDVYASGNPASQKVWLHVCDDSDGLIGATSDAGFKPS